MMDNLFWIGFVGAAIAIAVCLAPKPQGHDLLRRQ